MATIDKAAIVWTIAIVAFGAGIASLGDGLTGSSAPAAAPAPAQAPPTVAETMGEESMGSMAGGETMGSMMEGETMGSMMGGETMGSMMEDAPAQASGPRTVVVTIPVGTSVPGCEETDSCYVPSSVSVSTGDTVSWDNVDTVAHTVTSGTPSGGPDGKFDSSLLLGGNTFEVEFDEAGSYDYFCLVHPWMVGLVQVS